MKDRKIMRKTCSFAKAVVRKTQELFEISQLKIKIIQIKNKIERKYVRIGYFLYNKQKTDGFETLKEEIENEKFKNVCKEIDELYQKLEKLEEECSELKSYIKKDAKECIEKCGCKVKKHEKNEYDNDKYEEEFEEKKTLVTKEDEYEF